MLPFHTTRSRLGKCAFISGLVEDSVNLTTIGRSIVLSSDQLEKILDKASSSPTKLSSSPVLTIFYSHPVTPDPPRFPAISALNLPTSPFPIATHPISPWSYPPPPSSPQIFANWDGEVQQRWDPPTPSCLHNSYTIRFCYKGGKSLGNMLLATTMACKLMDVDKQLPTSRLIKDI